MNWALTESVPSRLWEGLRVPAPSRAGEPSLEAAGLQFWENPRQDGTIPATSLELFRLRSTRSVPFPPVPPHRGT